MPSEDRQMPVRVLFVGHTAKLSGGEIALLRLLPALRPWVEPVVVLAEDGPLVRRLEDQGIDVQVLELSATTRELRRDRLSSPLTVLRQLSAVLRYTMRLRRLIRARGIDIVHTNTLKAGYYGNLAARLAGVPSMWHVRDRLAEDYLPRPAVIATRLALTALPSRILCNSQATADTVTRGAFAARRRRLLVPPLYDPLDPETFSSNGTAGRRQADTFTIGMVGRLTPWKGQDVVIRALAEMSSSVRLVLVGAAMFGEVGYAEELREEVRRRGLTERVEFRGFTEDVSAALREMDVLVHASVVPEPFGQVIVEGLAAGVPVVAARGGGPSEIITHRRDGLLYEPGDVRGLVHLLRELQEDRDLRERLSERGRCRAEDFAPAVVCPALVRLYEGLRPPTQH